MDVCEREKERIKTTMSESRCSRRSEYRKEVQTQAREGEQGHL